MKTEKPYSIFLYFNNFNAAIFAVLLAVFCACTPENETHRRIKDAVSAHKTDINTLKAVIILADGECPTCNIRFSRAIYKYLNQKDILFFLNSRGTTFDISPFFDAKNVVFDEDDKFRHTSIFLFKSGKIEKSIRLNNENINKGVALLEQHY